MEYYERTLSGLAYLDGVTSLLGRMRNEHPTTGVWEAADFQWWWRKPRDTDSWGQLFWVDATGSPVAAAVVTDWGERFALDVISVPSADLVREVLQRSLAVLDQGESAIEVMVDDQDTLMISLLTDAGLARSTYVDGTAWMPAKVAPEVSNLSTGYSLTSRADVSGTPHHMVKRNGSQV